MTNGDRLRRMTDKQLAAFIGNHCCPPGEEDSRDCDGKDATCRKHWLEWMEKEAGA